MDAQPTFNKAFGEIVLKVEDGSGRISLPKQMDLSALTGLREALLAAMASCASIVLDWGAVERCDLFFFQMLCLAQLSCQARGIAFSVDGALDADLRTAATAMGFGCGIPECLFRAA
ncbi:MAG: STAS domain-containing protein [Proteobacteria bacterium]|nr:STAS domain-containing protein [Pseudomonadota bacterium]MBU1594554.1 STAS domain-containing protein [Pseudomonadota bacterium]